MTPLQWLEHIAGERCWRVPIAPHLPLSHNFSHLESTRMVKYSDIFVPGGFPRHTYDPRVDLQLEHKLYEARRPG